MKPAALARLMRLPIAASVLILGGCVVPLPFKESTRALEGQRENLGEQMPAFIVEGRTTREDILLTLGEPDGSSLGERWLLYRTGRSLGGVSLLAVIPAPSHGAVGEIARRETLVWRELTLHFDEQGILRKAEFVEQQDRGIHWLSPESGPPPSPPRVDPVPPVTLAYREARRAFVPAEPGERLLEGFIQAACQVQGQWHEATVFVTDRAVYCIAAPQADGTGPHILLRWTAGEVTLTERAPSEVAPDRPLVLLQHRDGANALFAFHPIDGAEMAFDSTRAELFLTTVLHVRGAAPR
jgi:hypothetical protein